MDGRVGLTPDLTLKEMSLLEINLTKGNIIQYWMGSEERECRGQLENYCLS